MQIIEIAGPVQACDTGQWVFTLTLSKSLSVSDIEILAGGGVLIFNPTLEPPYFKILTSDWTLRGAAFESRLIVQCHSVDNAICHKQLEQIIALINNN